jgi:hypothetical protein
MLFRQESRIEEVARRLSFSHARAPIEMLGGTTFHFVTGGIDAALNAHGRQQGTRTEMGKCKA